MPPPSHGPHAQPSKLPPAAVAFDHAQVATSNRTLNAFLGGPRPAWMTASNNAPARSSRPVGSQLAKKRSSVSTPIPQTITAASSSVPATNGSTNHFDSLSSLSLRRTNPSEFAPLLSPALTNIPSPSAACLLEPTNPSHGGMTDRQSNSGAQHAHSTPVTEDVGFNVRMNQNARSGSPLGGHRQTGLGVSVPMTSRISPNRMPNQTGPITRFSNAVNGQVHHSASPNKRPRLHNNLEQPTPPAKDMKSCLHGWRRVLDDRMNQPNGQHGLDSVIERPRYCMLREALAQGDVFYIVLHQIFCLWSRDRHQAYRRLLPQKTELMSAAFEILLAILRRNDELAPHHLTWFSSFPNELAVAPKSVNGYEAVVEQVKTFLAYLATRWSTFSNTVDRRGYPLMAWEMLAVFQCRSPVLRPVLFTMSRRKLGVEDGPLATELLRIFEADVRAEQQLGGDDVGRSPTTRLIEARKSSAARCRLLIGQKQTTLPFQNDASRTSQNGSPAFTPGVLEGRQRIPDQRTMPQAHHQAQPSPPPLLSARQGSRASPHLTQTLLLPRKSSSTSSMSPTQCQPQNFDGSMPRQAPHPLQAWPMLNGASPFHVAPNQVAYGGGNVMPGGPANLAANAPNIFPFRGTPVPVVPSLQQPLPRRDAGFPGPKLIGRNGKEFAGCLHQNSASPVSPLFPPPFASPTFTFSFSSPISMAASASASRQSRPSKNVPNAQSPKRIPSSLSKGRFYQFVSEFAAQPQLLSPQGGLQHVSFVVPDAAMVKRATTNLSTSSSPTCTYYEGCIRYRLRVCQRPAQVTSVRAADWITWPSYWPEHIHMTINGQPIFARRKQQFQHDLPIELTDLVAPGQNTIQISFSGNSSKKRMVHLMAVELVMTSSHASILAMQRPHASAATMKSEIQRRLQPNDSEDLIVANDDISINLADPFSASSFTIPVRGVDCRHLECFDLETWLETRPKKSRGKLPDEPCMVDVWKCPICDRDARPKSLLVDDFLVEVRELLMQQGKGNVKSIRARPDGTWDAVEESDDSDDDLESMTNGEKAFDQQSTSKKAPCDLIEIVDDD